MRRNINDISIRSKFVLLYLLGVLLPIIVLLVYVLTNVTTEIRAREYQNAEQSLVRVYDTLDTQFAGVLSLSNAISSDSKLAGLFSRQYHTAVEYYRTYYNTIRPTMNRYLNAYAQHVTNITVFTDNPTMANGGVCLRIDKEARSSEWYPKNDSTEVTLAVYPRNQVGQTGILQLCITRPLSGSAPYHEVLRIDLNMEPMHRLLAKETSFLSAYFVAPDGTAVCYPGSLTDIMIGKRAAHPPESPDLVLAFPEGSAMDGWKLVANINDEPMKTSVRQATEVGLVIGVICSLFAAGLSVVFARSIVLRSQRLLRHMDSMTADHFAPITHDIGHDEIGELIAHFNAMSKRLQQLITDLYVLQLQQKSMELENVRAELKYLQAQIDPHFLFNTLNAILVLCVRNGHTEEAEIIRALSKILRRMVDTSRDVVSLSEELEFVRMVLKIEQFRFGDKLRYEFDVSPEAAERSVAVMSVQGLVENACKHGIQSLNEPGVVRISARVEQDKALLIEVSDNGVGIETARLNELQKQISSASDIQGSVGLQNIYRRLRLHYGEAVTLSIRNADDRGTIVSIRIPAEGE